MSVLELDLRMPPDGFECLAEIRLTHAPDRTWLVHVRSLKGVAWVDAVYDEPVCDAIDGAAMTGRFFALPVGWP